MNTPRGSRIRETGGLRPPLAFVFLTLLALPLQAQTRVALVAADAAPEVEQLLSLAEAELDGDAGLALLDRKHIAQVVAEQKLVLSGLVDPESAAKVGKLLNVDVFAVVDVAQENTKQTLGLTAIDARSGVRLWDAPLDGDGLAATVPHIAAAVRGAVAKLKAKPSEVQTVGLLTVRNADLPQSQDVTVQAIARLLERQLLQSPGVVVVERDRLRALVQERNLPTKTPLPPLLASVTLIELEIARGGEAGLSAVARLSDNAGQERAVVRHTAADPFALSTGLLPKLVEALKVKPSDVALDRQREADRFSNESWSRWRHREWERAALEAEAAFALDPDNNRRLKWLIDRLAEWAIELVDPGMQTSGGKPRKPIEPEKLEQSLAIARHGLDLFGLLFARLRKDPHWYRDQNGVSSMWYRTHLSKVTAFDEKTTDRSREMVAEYVREFKRLEFDVHGRALHALAEDPAVFRVYTSWVSSKALLDAFKHFPSTQPDWSQTVADTLIQWADVAETHRPSGDKQFMRSADYVLSTVRWASRVPQRTPADFERLQTAYAHLERGTDPVLTLHGRLLSLHALRDAGKLPETQAKPEVETLVKEVQPHIIAADGPTQDFETRRRWIQVGLDANQLLTHEERAKANRGLFDLLETHGFYSERATYDVAQFYRSAEKTEELLAFLTRAVALLEKSPHSLSPNDWQRELASLREWRRTVAESLGRGTGTVTPWESAKTLLDVAAAESGVRSLVRPVVDGRTAYLLGMAWNTTAGEASFTLLKIDIDEGDVRQLSTHTIGGLPPAQFGDRTSLANGDVNQLTVIERSTTEGSYFLRSACLHEGHYVAATLGRGILVFPLDGGEPRVLGEKQGLPTDFAQSVLSHDGWLYAWLGQPQKTAYMCRMKLDGSRLEVIGSSRRTIRKSPLDNVSPVLCDFMHVDAPRKRIVFRLTNSNSDAVMGVWELRPDTLAVKQLARTHLILRGDPPRALPGERILVKDDFEALVFDLKTDTLKPLYRGTAGNPGLFRPLWLFGDDLWVGIPFGSVNVKTGTTQLFPSLREPGKTFQPCTAFVPVGEQGFLLSDGAGLWRIRLRP